MPKKPLKPDLNQYCKEWNTLFKDDLIKPSDFENAFSHHKELCDAIIDNRSILFSDEVANFPLETFYLYKTYDSKLVRHLVGPFGKYRHD